MINRESSCKQMLTTVYLTVRVLFILRAHWRARPHTNRKLVWFLSQIQRVFHSEYLKQILKFSVFGWMKSQIATTKN